MKSYFFFDQWSPEITMPERKNSVHFFLNLTKFDFLIEPKYPK